ncbi:transmembrane protein 121B [Callorhinchus milii]|uniref:transmembrane protein 121B n=1 Tax=Callorhinchus milii TaxID=7868 RepID=UPI001C3F7F57|nr:transmembrane protein 121B [Callorhinchus milii]
MSAAAPGTRSSRPAAPRRTAACPGEEGRPHRPHPTAAAAASASGESDALFIRNSSFRRNSQVSAANVNPEMGIAAAAAAAAIKARPAFIITTSGEFLNNTSDYTSSAPAPANRTAFYKTLCLLLLLLQGGVLDFYLIIFTDLYWCSWIATDLVVMGGWVIFFVKHAKKEREDHAKARPSPSSCAAARGEFAFAYLAWLIYVIACTPKMVLILETSILDLIELKVPLGTTGFKITVMSSVPLLYTLINSVTEDLTGHASYRAQSCYSRTCLDLLDSFTLMEMLLADQIPNATLKYTVTGVYFVSFFIPVLWLYQLNSLQLDYKCVVVRFLASYAVNGPLLVVRCFLVFLYGQQVSVFLFKNVFWLLCDCTELLEGFCTVRRVRKYSAPPVQFTRCISDHEMCAHGYVNTLAVTSQS